MNKFTESVELVDGGWMINNIGSSTPFWRDPWLEGFPFKMFSLGWKVIGEAWKRRRKLFAWDKELVEEV